MCTADLHTTERIRAVPRPCREIYGRGNNFLRGADARYVPSHTSSVKFIKGTSRHGSNGNMISTRLFFTTRHCDARNLLHDRSACNYIRRLQPRNVVAFSPQHRLRRNFTYARFYMSLKSTHHRVTVSFRSVRTKQPRSYTHRSPGRETWILSMRLREKGILILSLEW